MITLRFSKTFREETTGNNSLVARELKLKKNNALMEDLEMFAASLKCNERSPGAATQNA